MDCTCTSFWTQDPECPLHHPLVAFDRDTGRRLTDEQATKAADNPLLWTWVEWRRV